MEIREGLIEKVICEQRPEEDEGAMVYSRERAFQAEGASTKALGQRHPACSRHGEVASVMGSVSISLEQTRSERERGPRSCMSLQPLWGMCF